MQSASGEYKMAPTDFVDHIIDTVEEYLPTLARSYRDSVIDGRTWDADRLKTNLDHLAGRGQLRVENEARKKLTISRAHQGSLQKRAAEQMAYGINDHSNHDYDNDKYWEQWQVERDGTPRYDSYGYLAGDSGHTDWAHQQVWAWERDSSWNRPSKGDHKGKKGADKGGKGAKGDQKGSKGAKGGKGSKGGPKGGKASKGGKGRKGDQKGGKGYDIKQEPKRELKCTICEWLGKPWHVFTGHNDECCAQEGGGMEGYSINDCLRRSL